ncbi:MAG: hypothetical protein PHD97_11730 [Bacteroidales bacterium]|nr:hypothetical protein [Bacteroidales bacterium]
MRTIYFLLCLFLFGGCFQNQDNKDEASSSDTSKNTGWYRKKNGKGNLILEMYFKNGLQEGTSKSFYDDGKLRFEVPYKTGKREGLAKWYYGDGVTIYETIEYKGDRKNGTAKKYYKNGKLKSILPYKDDQPGIGLKEYDEKGKEVTGYPSIIIKEKRSPNKITLIVSLDNGSEDVEFYQGDLTDNVYMNKKLFSVYTQRGNGKIVYSFSKSSGIIRKINVIAKVTTKQNNIYLTQASYKVSL